MSTTRRELLKGGAGLVVAGTLAGCLSDAGDDSGSSGDRSGYAAFFTLADFTRNVGGDHFEIENPVPAGDMGHLWNPEMDDIQNIIESDAFVYLDIEGFQDDFLKVPQMAEDEGSDTVMIDALEGVDLLDFDGEGHDHEDHDDEDDHGDHDDEDHDEHDHGEEDDHDDEDHDEHDHGDYDPHYWVDPIRAQQSVETIADGLSEADPDNADTYEENAAEYTDRLQDLHETYESELESREHDVVVLAGHDSYQYLATRYEFEIHSPSGVQPDAEPSESEIAETVELIDEEGIDVILYDYFESEGGDPPRLARTILDESSATDAAAISPVEGTTDEWDEEGYGYVEQMEEINLPAVKEALGAE